MINFLFFLPWGYYPLKVGLPGWMLRIRREMGDGGQEGMGDGEHYSRSRESASSPGSKFVRAVAPTKAMLF